MATRGAALCPPPASEDHHETGGYSTARFLFHRPGHLRLAWSIARTLQRIYDEQSREHGH